MAHSNDGKFPPQEPTSPQYANIDDLITDMEELIATDDMMNQSRGNQEERSNSSEEPGPSFRTASTVTRGEDGITTTSSGGGGAGGGMTRPSPRSVMDLFKAVHDEMMPKMEAWVVDTMALQLALEGQRKEHEKLKKRFESFYEDMCQKNRDIHKIYTDALNKLIEKYSQLKEEHERMFEKMAAEISNCGSAMNIVQGLKCDLLAQKSAMDAWGRQLEMQTERVGEQHKELEGMILEYKQLAERNERRLEEYSNNLKDYNGRVEGFKQELQATVASFTEKFMREMEAKFNYWTVGNNAMIHGVRQQIAADANKLSQDFAEIRLENEARFEGVFTQLRVQKDAIAGVASRLPQRDLEELERKFQDLCGKVARSEDGLKTWKEKTIAELTGKVDNSKKNLTDQFALVNRDNMKRFEEMSAKVEECQKLLKAVTSTPPPQYAHRLDEMDRKMNEFIGIVGRFETEWNARKQPEVGDNREDDSRSAQASRPSKKTLAASSTSSIVPYQEVGFERPVRWSTRIIKPIEHFSVEQSSSKGVTNSKRKSTTVGAVNVEGQSIKEEMDVAHSSHGSGARDITPPPRAVERSGSPSSSSSARAESSPQSFSERNQCSPRRLRSTSAPKSGKKHCNRKDK